jgi:hypothetical protein
MITKITSLKDKKKITYFFLLFAIIFILNTQNILGATNTSVPLPPFPNNPQATASQDATNIIIQENIKTRMEIKQYCDQKIATMIETVKTEGQNFIGQNFAEFDKRIHELSNKIFIKIIIGIFSTVLLACIVYYIIKRKIEKKHMPRAMNFREVAISPNQVGLIAEPMKTEITPPIPRIKPIAPTPTTNDLPTFPQTELSPPIPPQAPLTQQQQLTQLYNQQYQQPTFPNLQQPIILSPRERDRIIREQEEVERRRKKEAEKKLNKLIDEHNRVNKQRKKLKEKLSKPEQEKIELDAEHENIDKEIEEISKKYGIVIPRK